jgi:dihydrofolate reductase
MRALTYGVAMSLDGFIADSDGGYDWIVHDPAIDFAALFARFDTAVMGRKTFDGIAKGLKNGRMHGLDVVVASRTLADGAYPGVTIVSDRIPETVGALKERPGKDIWLFGGGALFRTLLDGGVVDSVEVAVIPVILGGGVPMVERGRRMPPMRLKETTRYPSGIVSLSYDVRPDAS